jgi:hypothetical protein
MQIVALMMFAMLSMWNAIDARAEGLRWAFVALAIGFGSPRAYEVWRLR